MESLIRKDIKEFLPHRPPFLFIDKVLSIDSDTVTAVKTFKENEEYLKGHFPGNPIVPGVLIIESMAQAAGIIVSQGLDNTKKTDIFYLAKVIDVRFKISVLPGDTMIIKAKVLRKFENSVKAHVKGTVKDRIVAEGELILSKKGRGV